MRDCEWDPLIGGTHATETDRAEESSVVVELDDGEVSAEIEGTIVLLSSRRTCGPTFP